MPPLRPDASQVLTYRPLPYTLPEIAARSREDVQLLPFGPVRADVLESAQFTSTTSARVCCVMSRNSSSSIAAWRSALRAWERTRGQCSPSGYPGSGVLRIQSRMPERLNRRPTPRCRVAPNGCGCCSPNSSRLYNHLHYLGYLCHTTTLKVGEAQGKYLEEVAKQINARVSGSRFLRALITPGGLRREPRLGGLDEALRKLGRRFALCGDARKQWHPPRSFDYHRQGQSGTCLRSRATGPIERASGLDRDLRRDHPYEAYAELPLRVALREEGDAHARQQVRIREISNSIELIRAILGGLPEGSIRVSSAVAPGMEGLGWAESPRGSVYYAVHVDGAGRLGRVKIKSPSFSNWYAFAFTVHDSNMMDYAINEASFGLSIAGCDR